MANENTLSRPQLVLPSSKTAEKYIDFAARTVCRVELRVCHVLLKIMLPDSKECLLSVSNLFSFSEWCRTACGRERRKLGRRRKGNCRSGKKITASSLRKACSSSIWRWVSVSPKVLFCTQIIEEVQLEHKTISLSLILYHCSSCNHRNITVVQRQQ